MSEGGLLIGVLLALFALSRVARGGGSGGGGPSWGLSPIRTRALEILRDVVPSAYPDARFAAIVGRNFDPAASLATTCGALPGYMGVQLGDPGGITHWGVPGVRDVAKATGSWVEAGEGRVPKPGDVYLTAFPPGHEKAGQVSHTGIVVESEGWKPGALAHWTTADAGQGTRLAPRAEYVVRTYDPKANLLRQASSPDSEGRTLLGWLDLDAYARSRGGWPFPRRSGLVEAQQAWRFEDAPAWDTAEKAKS